MAVKVKEVQRSRQYTSSESPTAKLEYVITGDVDNPEIVELYVLAYSPPTLYGIKRKSITIRPHEKLATTFTAEVDYSKDNKNQEPPTTGDEDISFDLTPQTTRITQSKSTILRTPGFAPDFKGGIGFKSGQEGFEGADVFVPSLAFSITKYVPIAEVTNAYIQTLMEAAFKVNDDYWRGFEAGEVLFAGASGAKRNEADYAITFRFMASKNAENVKVGDLTVAEKSGWDYLWVLYDEREDEFSASIVQRPTAAYVERVYDEINFPTYIGLGA